MRPSSCSLAFLGLLAALFGAMLLHARAQDRESALRRQRSADLVRTLGLTDLCLTTEARYTRHPAMADRHAAFQDHPGAPDHFPSGTFFAPPTFTAPHALRPSATPEHP